MKRECLPLDYLIGQRDEKRGVSFCAPW
jgi:hypothetical protein